MNDDDSIDENNKLMTTAVEIPVAKISKEATISISTVKIAPDTPLKCEEKHSGTTVTVPENVPPFIDDTTVTSTIGNDEDDVTIITSSMTFNSAYLKKTVNDRKDQYYRIDVDPIVATVDSRTSGKAERIVRLLQRSDVPSCGDGCRTNEHDTNVVHPNNIDTNCSPSIIHDHRKIKNTGENDNNDNFANTSASGGVHNSNVDTTLDPCLLPSSYTSNSRKENICLVIVKERLAQIAGRWQSRQRQQLHQKQQKQQQDPQSQQHCISFLSGSSVSSIYDDDSMQPHPLNNPFPFPMAFVTSWNGYRNKNDGTKIVKAIEKCVCSTLCPTLLPLPSLHDLQSCLSFVHLRMGYEPLGVYDDNDDNDRAVSGSASLLISTCKSASASASTTKSIPGPPYCLPSPWQTWDWGGGDCFDLSVLLASFLLGSGYDVYVVYGTAPRWIRAGDGTTSMMNKMRRGSQKYVPRAGIINSLSGNGDVEWDWDAVGLREHLVWDRGGKKAVLDAKYEDAVENLELEEEISEGEEDENIEKGEDERVGNDGNQIHCNIRKPKGGEGIHCWVLVKPGLRSDLEFRHYFAEPSTGELYSTTAVNPDQDQENESSPTKGLSLLPCPYLRIMGVWNTKNYWVNLDAHRGGMPNFDLEDSDTWESVFHNTRSPKSVIEGPKLLSQKELVQPDMIRDRISLESKLYQPLVPFDPPSSWVGRMNIPTEQFRSPCPPDKRRVVQYYKAMLEIFPQRYDRQGLLERVTFYRDMAKLEAREIRETFGDSRGDRLLCRTRLPFDSIHRETFVHGHSGCLHEWTEIYGKRRIVKFRRMGRPDGLVLYDETFGDVIVEGYLDRHDNLSERIITGNELAAGVISNKTEKGNVVLSNGGCQNFLVTKIVETYESPGTNISSTSMARRTFFLVEDKIETEYYKEQGSIARMRVVYIKDRDSNVDERDYCDGIKAEHQQMSVAENSTLSSIRDVHQEISNLVRMRRREEDCLQLDVSSRGEDKLSSDASVVMDGKCNDPNLSTKNSTTIDNKSQNFDYLSSHLLFVKDSLNITKEEALCIRDACLKTVKDRLIERANIIQNRLHVENERLASSQASYQQRDAKNEGCSEREFEKICVDVTFRIKVLERRLHEHEELSIEKYEAMEKRLVDDPRISMHLT